MQDAGDAWHAGVSLASERQLQHVANSGRGHVYIALAQFLVPQRMLLACAKQCAVAADTVPIVCLSNHRTLAAPSNTNVMQTQPGWEGRGGVKRVPMQPNTPKMSVRSGRSPLSTASCSRTCAAFWQGPANKKCNSKKCNSAGSTSTSSCHRQPVLSVRVLRAPLAVPTLLGEVSCCPTWHGHTAARAPT